MLIIFVSIFLITILYRLFMSMSDFNASKSVVLDENQSYTLDKSLSGGCYEVGFASKGELFYSPLHLPYSFQQSKFTVTFFNKQNQEIKKTIVDSNSELQHGFIGTGAGIKKTYTALDLFPVPLEGFQNIKVKIDVEGLEQRLKHKPVEMYFRKYAKSQECKDDELQKILFIRANPITKAETNSTLVPLHQALVTKDTQRVKQILDANATLCDASFLGDRTVFHYSAFYNDVDTLTYLVERCQERLLHQEDIAQKSPLIYAAEHNATVALEFLFEHGGKCPEQLDTKLLHNYIGDGTIYSNNGHPRDDIENFFYDNNLPELAEVFAKNQCSDFDKRYKSFNRSVLLTDLMEQDIKNREYEKRRNAPGWESKKDYTKLREVFKKYSKDTNTTQRIDNGK